MDRYAQWSVSYTPDALLHLFNTAPDLWTNRTAEQELGYSVAASSSDASLIGRATQLSGESQCPYLSLILGADGRDKAVLVRFSL